MNGPTDDHPNPLTATLTKEQLESRSSGKRKAPKHRNATTNTKKRKLNFEKAIEEQDEENETDFKIDEVEGRNLLLQEDPKSKDQETQTNL